MAVDPIHFELIRNALGSIADEMALTIVRTSHSGVLKDNMDFSTAICDARGRMLAQGLTLPMHLGSVPAAMDGILRRYPAETIQPGDVFILNDPFEGGMHLPDVFIVKPLFVDGTLARPTPLRSLPRACASRCSSTSTPAGRTKPCSASSPRTCVCQTWSRATCRPRLPRV
jgi:hypothetical protein